MSNSNSNSTTIDQPWPREDCNVEPSPIQALATQLKLSRRDTEFVINIVKHNDPPIEWRKDPKVLHIIKQRKGRWVKDEEDFANFLNNEFCLGLSAVANGTTKRAFLSSKLSCTKMRVSKKFKGQNTGKEVFDCKTHEFSALEINYYKQRHIELEKKFIRSVLKSEINGYVKNSQKKNPLSHPCSSHLAAETILRDVPNSEITTTTTYAPPTVSGGTSKIEVSMPAPNLLGQEWLKRENHLMVINSGPEPSASDQHTRRASTCLNAPVVNSHAPSGIGMQFSTIAHQDSTFLSPSFTNQFQSMSTKSPDPFHTMSSAFPTQSIHHQEDLADRRLNTWIASQKRECNNKMEGSKKRRLDDASSRDGKKFRPIPAVSQDGTSASDSSQSEERANLASPNEESTDFAGIPPHRVSIVQSETICNDNDIPDLLVGFDKHVASMKKTTSEALSATVKHRPIPEDSHFFAGADCGESPYITSKSFDELHKYLGKGLSSDKMPHLDLNEHHHPGWPVGVYCVPKHNGGFQPYSGAHHPNALIPPLSTLTRPSLDVPSQYNMYRPSSTSNCSDLTCSD